MRAIVCLASCRVCLRLFLLTTKSSSKRIFPKKNFTSKLSRTRTIHTTGKARTTASNRSRRPHRSRRRIRSQKADGRIREHRGARREDHPHHLPTPSPPPLVAPAAPPAGVRGGTSRPLPRQHRSATRQLLQVLLPEEQPPLPHPILSHPGNGADHARTPRPACQSHNSFRSPALNSAIL